MLTRHSVVRKRFNKSSLGRQPLCKKSPAPARSLTQAGIFTLTFKESFLTYPQLSQDRERAREIQSLESKQIFILSPQTHTGLLAVLFCVYHFFSKHTKKKLSTCTYVVILNVCNFLELLLFSFMHSSFH